MAIPRSAWASAAASLTPSPTMATPRPSACRARITSTLSAGSTSARTSASAIPTSRGHRLGHRPRGHRSAAAAVSPSSRNRRDGRGRGRLDLVGHRHRPAGQALPADGDDRTAAVRLRASIAAGQLGRQGQALGGQQELVDRRARSRPSTTPADAAAFEVGEVATGSSSAGSTAAAIARPIGCSEAVLHGGGQGQHASARPPRAAVSTSATAITPVVTVPVLSSTTVSTVRVDSSASGPLIRIPSCAPATGTDHQRQRRGQPEGARAGDDQHRDRGGEGGGRTGAEPQPEPEGGHGESDDDGDEDRRRSGRPAAAPGPCRSGPPPPGGPSGPAGCRSRPGWLGRRGVRRRSRRPRPRGRQVRPRPARTHRSASTCRPPSCPARRSRRWRSPRRVGRRTGRRPRAARSAIRTSTPSRSTATSLAPSSSSARNADRPAAWSAPRCSGRPAGTW